ncbi:MAG: nucleotidyl transferase AbiEii/AbiGii toxin family protein [bacterium]
MFKDVFPEEQSQNLEILVKKRVISGFYLAGGTGASLQLGHRISFDLDLFTNKPFNCDTILRKLKEIGDFSLDIKDEETIIGLFKGTRISLFKYPYPLLFPQEEFRGIKVASLEDIGCMKLDAVSSRGTKRDFIDLYFILKERIKLDEAIELFKKKYKGIDYNIVHILKSLVYFEDAEKEPMPMMLKDINWKDIKSFFKEKVRVYFNEGRE